MTKTKRRPNQMDIAEQLGVSISTVSRALANEAGISDMVRVQVQQMAETIGYRSKHVALAAVPQRRAVTLVPLNKATRGLSGFYEDIAKGLRSEALRLGVNMDLRLVNEDHLTSEQVEQHLQQSRATCVLLLGIDPSDAVAQWLIDNDIIVILVNGSDPRMRFSSIAPANFYGARLGTERLLAAGHRRIIHLTYNNRATIHERTRGFEAAIAGLPDAEGRVVRIGANNSIEEVARLIADGFTAVFFMNDMIAVDVVESTTLRKMVLPRGFSVLGFDDLPCASMITPRLSTMQVDREGIGRGAVRLLADAIEGNALIQQIELGVTFIEGGTILQFE